MCADMIGDTSKSGDTFSQFFIYLASQKKRLLINFTVAVIIAFAIAFTLPFKYVSSFSFLPPSGSSGFAAGLLGDMQIGNLTDANNPNAQQVLFILKSGSIPEKLVKQFDLVHRYETHKTKKPMTLAVAMLQKNTIIEETTEGGLGYEEIIGINVSIIDRDPDTAFLMASTYHKELEHKFIEVFSRKASFDMEYYDRFIQDVNGKLKIAQDSFLAFQRKNGIFAPAEQAEASIKLYADMASQMEARKIQLKLQARDYGANSQSVVKLKDEIAVLDEELNRLNKEPMNRFFVRLTQIPEQALEYFNRKRDLEVLEKTYLLLFQQYKQAEFQSKKDIPILKIVDYPAKPEYKFKPKRLKVIAILVFAENLLFLLALMLFFIWWRLDKNNPKLKLVIDVWLNRS